MLGLKIIVFKLQNIIVILIYYTIKLYVFPNMFNRTQSIILLQPKLVPFCPGCFPKQRLR